jgi:hypothetical protein
MTGLSRPRRKRGVPKLDQRQQKKGMEMGVTLFYY